MLDSRLALRDRSIARNTTRSSASNTTIKFKVKPITYFEGGFSNQGSVKNRYGRYGQITIKPNKVSVRWDDEQKSEIWESLAVAQNWGLIEAVPWFIANQTVVSVPLLDGSITRACKFLVESIDETWIQLIGLDEADLVDNARSAKYEIAHFPGFPLRNLVDIKSQPLLPIPARYELETKAGVKLWNTQLIDLIGREYNLFTEFREEFSSLSSDKEDFRLAWESAWDSHLTRKARDCGHSDKKIGTRFYIDGAIEQITDFDTSTFEFVTDTDRRIPLLKLYLYSELRAIELAPNFFILRAGDFVQARIGFNNKDTARKREVAIRHGSGCKVATLCGGEVTSRKHEYVLDNPYKKADTFVKRLNALAKRITL